MQINRYFSEPESSQHRFRGWRRAVIAAAIVTAVVLCINVIFAIVVSAKYGADDGVGVIYAGDCGLVKRWDTALHLLINVLGTCLLAASSFTMQCLSSPTRSETDAAHAKRKTLDVGIPSFKNLWHLKKWKVCLWWGLAVSTMPLHLLWNSTVFSTLGANEFAYIVVDESFLNGAEYIPLNETACSRAPYDVPNVKAVYDAYRAGNFSSRMSPADCIKMYGTAFITSRTFLAVTKANTNMRMSPGCAFNQEIQNLTVYYGNPATKTALDNTNTGYPQPLWNNSGSVLGYEFIGTNRQLTWLCTGFDAGGDQSWQNCGSDKATELLTKNGTWYLRPDNLNGASAYVGQSYPIEYCLAEEKDTQTCQLQYVSYILFVVIACNAIKVGCMAAAAYWLWNLDEPIFATIGDCVASYMEKPDETTKGWCMLDSYHYVLWKFKAFDLAGRDIYMRKSRKRLFSATSKGRWFTTIGLCSVYLLLGFILLGLSVQAAEGFYTLSAIWKLGLGAINSNTTLGIGGHSASGLISGVVVANTFQLALSTTYFLYNSLYTAQCGALEWSTYADPKRKPLRVTWPRGQQRSTYYLHLPYKYGIPLTVFLMLLHFLISQSIFLARVQWYNMGGFEDDDNYISDVGFSPVAILVTVCVGALLVIAQIAHSFRPLDNKIPIHGNSSVVISSMCHTGTGTYENDRGVMFYHPEENMALRNVMWGATRQPKDEDEIGHCSFTADAVEPPIFGRRYR